MESEKAAFRQRQRDDMQRRGLRDDGVSRRQAFYKRLETQRRRANRGYDHSGSDGEAERDAAGESGEEGWRNAEGDRLADFGLDEDAEFYDEDEVPLAKLISRRRERSD